MGKEHLWTLAVISLVFTIILIFFRKFASPRTISNGRWTIAFALIMSELSYHVYAINIGTWEVAINLPLNLCGLNVILTSYTLITKNQKTFPFCYFWAIGALHSLLTPIPANPFPHFTYVQFFLGHSLIILGVLFLIVTENMRPTFQSVHKTALVTLLIAGIVALIDIALDANYMFLCEKPTGINITGFMPDALYIPLLLTVGIAHMYLFYIPFAITNRRAKKTVHPTE